MQDINLKEKVEHGSSFRPFHMMRFDMGRDTFFVPNHWHEEVELLYIMRGHYQLERNMRKAAVTAGDICFVNQQEIHQLVGLEPGTFHFAVVFHPRMLSFELFDESQSFVMKPLLSGESRLPDRITPDMSCYEKIRGEFLGIIQAAQEEKMGWYLRCKASLLSILASLVENGLLEKSATVPVRADADKMNRIKKMLAYLEEHYQEKVYTADMAVLLNMNEQYFCRFFKSAIGRTLTDYLNRYRIEKAAQSLKESDKKVLEICMECGFDNFSYFIKKFREYKGMTPAKYRLLQ